MHPIAVPQEDYVWEYLWECWRKEERITTWEAHTCNIHIQAEKPTRGQNWKYSQGASRRPTFRWENMTGLQDEMERWRNLHVFLPAPNVSFFKQVTDRFKHN